MHDHKPFLPLLGGHHAVPCRFDARHFLGVQGNVIRRDGGVFWLWQRRGHKFSDFRSDQKVPSA
jgi:hypothetical protein